MSNSERIKAEIGFHEKMFFAALAIVLGLIGWAASNYLNASTIILTLAFIGIIGASLFGGYQYRRIKQLLKELENA